MPSRTQESMDFWPPDIARRFDALNVDTLVHVEQLRAVGEPEPSSAPVLVAQEESDSDSSQIGEQDERREIEETISRGKKRQSDNFEDWEAQMLELQRVEPRMHIELEVASESAAQQPKAQTRDLRHSRSFTYSPVQFLVRTQQKCVVFLSWTLFSRFILC
jgi:hypothetical protein